MTAQATVLEQNELVAILASYVPDVVLRRLACDPRPLSGPLTEKLIGATLVADVSGFTAITESLARQGALGAEKLNAVLNDYFGRAIATIYGTRRRRGAFCRRRRARCLVRRVCARRQRPECLGRPLRLGPAIGTSRVPHAGRHAALGESGNRGRRVRDHARRGRARSLGLPGGRACLRPGLHGAGQGRPGTSRGVVAQRGRISTRCSRAGS